VPGNKLTEAVGFCKGEYGLDIMDRLPRLYIILENEIMIAVWNGENCSNELFPVGLTMLCLQL